MAWRDSTKRNKSSVHTCTWLYQSPLDIYVCTHMYTHICNFRLHWIIRIWILIILVTNVFSAFWLLWSLGSFEKEECLVASDFAWDIACYPPPQPALFQPLWEVQLCFQPAL